MNLLRRLRGALGFGLLGAVGFHLIGWLIIGAEAIAAGAWPTFGEILRMTRFTVPVGGAVGILSAGAIALGAGSAKAITKGRAFLIGLPGGVLGGLAMSTGLPLEGVLFVSGSVGIATGMVGAAAVGVANRAVGPGDDQSQDLVSGEVDQAETALEG